jgi:hypothetical protein
MGATTGINYLRSNQSLRTGPTSSLQKFRAH